jgi:hypothetical protein
MAGQVMGKFLIAAGVVLIVLGLLSYALPLFRLPGDIRYEGENFKIYFPIVTCIIISIILTILFNFFRK